MLQFVYELVLDTSRSDGTPQRLLDISRIPELGGRAKATLERGRLHLRIYSTTAGRRSYLIRRFLSFNQTERLTDTVF